MLGDGKRVRPCSIQSAIERSSKTRREKLNEKSMKIIIIIVVERVTQKDEGHARETLTSQHSILFFLSRYGRICVRVCVLTQQQSFCAIYSCVAATKANVSKRHHWRVACYTDSLSDHINIITLHLILSLLLLLAIPYTNIYIYYIHIYMDEYIFHSIYVLYGSTMCNIHITHTR